MSNLFTKKKTVLALMGGMLLCGSSMPVFARGPQNSQLRENFGASSVSSEPTDNEGDAKTSVLDKFKPVTQNNSLTNYDFDRYRIGGYGEMVARFKDYGQNRWNGTSNGNLRKRHNEISIPRFVLSGDYKFSPKWILGAEIEFESGGTGSAYEIEDGISSENGEYETETEKGGEVALEQFHITRLVVPEFNVRVGHMVLPVGLTNTHHEPLFFFSAERPESETEIIPSTWHETGLEFFGNFGKGLASFSYQAMVTSGLCPDGFSKYDWVKGGKQGAFEFDNFTAPAYTFRLNWHGVKGLRLGFSMLYNPKSGKNCEKLTKYDNVDDINIFIYSFDAQYINRYFTARANVLHGYVSNTYALNSTISSGLNFSSLSPYETRKGVGSHSLGYNAEVGVNLAGFFPNVEKFPVIYPFAQYAYYNPQETVDRATALDKRLQVSMWTVGLNWKPLPFLVVKADWVKRNIGTHAVFGSSKYNHENEVRLGVAYSLWFAKK